MVKKKYKIYSAPLEHGGGEKETEEEEQTKALPSVEWFLLSQLEVN